MRQRRWQRVLAAIASGSLLIALGSSGDVSASQPAQAACQPAPGAFELVGGLHFSGIRDTEPAALFGRREIVGSPLPATLVTPTPPPTPYPTPLPICTPTPTPTTTVVDDDPQSSATPTPTPLPEPDAGAVAPANVGRLIRFIETTSGRTFPGPPPPIRFLQPSQLGTSTVDELVPLEMWDLLQVTGLVSEGDDRELAAQAWSETARGQCCPVVVVDGHDRISNEIIIVHELTHFLDWPMIRYPSNREIVAPERAIVEGNAHRVAYAYLDSLNLVDVAPPPAIFPPGIDPRMPSALQEIFEYPYDEGLDFTRALQARGGEEAVLEAFERPPLGVEVLHPDLWFDQIEWATVATPNHLVLDPVNDHGQLGAFFLKLLLEPVAGTEEAHELAGGWRGDAYAMTTSPDRRCIGIVINTDSATTAALIAEHLKQINNASSKAIADRVEFARCLYPPRAS